MKRINIHAKLGEAQSYNFIFLQFDTNGRITELSTYVISGFRNLRFAFTDRIQVH